MKANSSRFGVVERGLHADALVVVVVPDDVDLGCGLEQVGRGLLAGLDRELGGDPVVDVLAAGLERVLEALRAVLGQRQRRRCRRSRRPRRSSSPLVLDHLAGVGAGRDAHAVVVAEDRGRARRTGEENSRSTLITGMPASIALVATSVSAAPSVGSSTIASTLSLMKVSIWLICWLASLVPSALFELDVVVLLRLLERRAVDGGEPAVVGGRAGEADDDLLARVVVGRRRPSCRCWPTVLSLSVSLVSVLQARQEQHRGEGGSGGQPQPAAVGGAGHGCSFVVFRERCSWGCWTCRDAVRGSEPGSRGSRCCCAPRAAAGAGPRRR